MGRGALHVPDRAGDDMEQIENTPLPEKEKQRPQERVTLGPDECRKLDGWLEQANKSSKGFLNLSRSDMVNFLVRQHKDELLPKEIAQIRADHYDPIKHITWITPQIKQALLTGDMARVSELQEELRKVELAAVKTNPKRREGPSVEGKPPRQKRKPKTQSMPNDAEQSVRISENS